MLGMEHILDNAYRVLHCILDLFAFSTAIPYSIQMQSAAGDNATCLCIKRLPTIHVTSLYQEPVPAMLGLHAIICFLGRAGGTKKGCKT